MSGRKYSTDLLYTYVAISNMFIQRTWVDAYVVVARANGEEEEEDLNIKRQFIWEAADGAFFLLMYLYTSNRPCLCKPLSLSLFLHIYTYGGAKNERFNSLLMTDGDHSSFRVCFFFLSSPYRRFFSPHCLCLFIYSLQSRELWRPVMLLLLLFWLIFIHFSLFVCLLLLFFFWLFLLPPPPCDVFVLCSVSCFRVQLLRAEKHGARLLFSD